MYKQISRTARLDSLQPARDIARDSNFMDNPITKHINPVLPVLMPRPAATSLLDILKPLYLVPKLLRFPSRCPKASNKLAYQLNRDFAFRAALKPLECRKVTTNSFVNISLINSHKGTINTINRAILKYNRDKRDKYIPHYQT